MANIPLHFAWERDKFIRFDLSRKTWLTKLLVLLGAAASITYGSMLISQSRTMNMGKGVVYQGPSGKRIRCSFDEFPDRVYDTDSPDPNLPDAQVVKVWTNGNTPWSIRSIGDTAPTGSGEVSYMGIIYILVGVLLLIWFVMNTKNKKVL